MKNIRVGTASLNQTPMDWSGNISRILFAMQKSRRERIDILCLPELCISGYGCEDMFMSPHVQEKSLEMLEKIADNTYKTAILGLPVRHKNSLYNCAAVIQNGKVMGIVPKQNRATDGVHYEPRWFRGWPKGKISSVQVGDEKVPFGDLIFELEDGIRFGFEICEDAWVAERTGASLSKRGVDIIFNPSASHFSFGKHEIRKDFVREGSRAFGCAYVYTNLVGNESGKLIFDGASLIASEGKILQDGPRFSFKEININFSDIDINSLRVGRMEREGFVSDDKEEDKGIVSIMGKSRDEASKMRGNLIQSQRKEDEFERALTLGLFDYMRKSGVKGYVVSLSGGADSSACAILVASMIKKAKDELSDNEILKMTGIEAKDFTVENLLTTAYQGTRNSSDTTLKAAEAVARDIGSKHLQLDVDSLVEAYKETVGYALNVNWAWDEHDITLQNIQARVRSPSIWMIANVENKILLATSNRSEASLGYFSQGGDDSGGLAPILGIDKNFLLHWLQHKENRFPSLKFINNQQPTAELRPEKDNQTDEEDLMPYDVLDAIENLAILEKKSPNEVLAFLESYPRFSHYEKEDFRAWVIRFFKLWSRNQWKRHRAAASFHLDDKSVDPQSWCRFPLLNSGYKGELKNLSDEETKND